MYLPLVLAYAAMVALNGAAIANFDRGATDGYALSYVQPDGATFSVWGVIYVLLLLLVLNSSKLYPDTRSYLVIAFLCNGLWLFCNGLAVVKGLSYWLAVFVLLAYATCLVLAYASLRVDYTRRSAWDRATLFAPVSANLSWVLLAALLNLANTLMDDRADFKKHENLTRVGGPDFAIGVLGLAALVSVVLAATKSDFVFSAVCVWALLGVARHQTPGSGFPHAPSPALKEFAERAALGVALSSTVCVLARAATAWRASPDARAEEPQPLRYPDEGGVRRETAGYTYVKL
jgi:hypothetical protein